MTSVFPEFETIVGNDQVKRYLTHMIMKNRVGQSFLFAGPDGIGKGLFSLALAKILICQNDPTGTHRIKIEKNNHPDIRIYRPEGKAGMHSIDSMRQFSQEVYLAPYEAKKKIFIVHDAERMLPYSANALLKTFEEPPLNSLIILLSSRPQDLLPTILSRCRRVFFQPIPEKLVRQERGPAHDLLLKILAKGKMATYSELKQLATDLASKAEQTRDSLEVILRKEIFKGQEEDITTFQKDFFEKELEGALSNRYREDIFGLFHEILAWFRDLLLLQSKGETCYLMHPEHETDLEQALQRGDLRKLEDVQKIIDEAKLAVERFIPLNSIFESLFLKLNFL